jgi:trans-feruloyl-CoA hydratase/vanillin synthase
MPAFEAVRRTEPVDGVTYDTLLIEVDPQSGVTVLTLNRPDKRNAMNPRLHEEITDALDRLQYDERVRVLVITGAGKAFSAGMDLEEFFAEHYERPGEFDRMYQVCSDWRGRTLRNYAKPTIAMVNGPCFGGAFSIVEGCDLAVAAESAKFGLSEINFGIFPGGPVAKTLANIMRPRDAMYYALTGKPFAAKVAQEIGFINYAVPDAELRENVMALAAEIGAKNPEAARATKEAYRYSLDMNWDAALHYAFVRQQALTYRQKGAWLDTGVKDFVEGKYRPGLESHPGLGKK